MKLNALFYNENSLKLKMMNFLLDNQNINKGKHGTVFVLIVNYCTFVFYKNISILCYTFYSKL